MFQKNELVSIVDLNRETALAVVDVVNSASGKRQRIKVGLSGFRNKLIPGMVFLGNIVNGMIHDVQYHTQGTYHIERFVSL